MAAAPANPFLFPTHARRPAHPGHARRPAAPKVCFGSKGVFWLQRTQQPPRTPGTHTHTATPDQSTNLRPNQLLGHHAPGTHTHTALHGQGGGGGRPGVFAVKVAAPPRIPPPPHPHTRTHTHDTAPPVGVAAPPGGRGRGSLDTPEGPVAGGQGCRSLSGGGELSYKYIYIYIY